MELLQNQFYSYINKNKNKDKLFDEDPELSLEA